MFPEKAAGSEIHTKMCVPSFMFLLKETQQSEMQVPSKGRPQHMWQVSTVGVHSSLAGCFLSVEKNKNNKQFFTLFFFFFLLPY